jgi:hypothetical protein
MRIRAMFLITLLLILAGAACQLQAGEIPAKLSPGFVGVGRVPVVKSAKMCDRLKVELEVPQSEYRLGLQVPMTLSITNTSQQPVTLRFSSGRRYDFVVSQGGNEIWRWSYGMAFTQAFTSTEIAPGRTVSYTGYWSQQDNDGHAVPAGTYQVTGTVTTMDPAPMKAGPVTVTTRK